MTNTDKPKGVFNFHKDKIPKGQEYIAGVPNRDLTDQDWSQFSPRQQDSIIASPFFVPTAEGRRIINERKKEEESQNDESREALVYPQPEAQKEAK